MVPHSTLFVSSFTAPYLVDLALESIFEVVSKRLVDLLVVLLPSLQLPCIFIPKCKPFLSHTHQPGFINPKHSRVH